MPEQTLYHTFLTTLSRFRKISASFPGDCDLQLVEWTIMQEAACHPGQEAKCLNVAQLQQKLHISRPGISQSLSALERKGYIVREADQMDRRKIIVHVTEDGRKKLAQSCAIHNNMMEQLLTQFGPDNMTTLCQQLNVLADIYENLSEPTLD